MLVATRLAAGFRDEVIISPDPRICMQRGSQCSAHIVFHLRFRHLLPVFQDGKVRGGIRRNGSKNLSQVSRRAIIVLVG